MRTSIILIAMLALIAGYVGGEARAETLTWDGDTDYANGLSSGDANWNATAVWHSPACSTNVIWNSATPDDAILPGIQCTTTARRPL